MPCYPRYFLPILIFANLSLCLAQEGALSIKLNGSIYQNNFGVQQFGDYRLETFRGNTGIGLSIAYRYYPIRSRVSYEAGLELGKRNFRISERDITQTLLAQEYAGRGTYLALPLRIYYGAKPARRNRHTRSSGLYGGLEFIYWSIADDNFQDGPARDVLREERRRIRPNLLLGVKTSGGVINSSMEFSFPILTGTSTTDVDGDQFSYLFRELIWQVSIGHSF